MKDFKSIYQEEYEKLNKQQQQAVDSVEGPVMVIAGPGAGKTQILSRCVANILTNYHKNPEEISGVVSVNELREYGQQLLKNLYENYIPNSLKGENVSLEKEINVRLEGNYLINGIIDKLEYDNDIIRVVDYKTGSAEQGLEELVFGRSYWRQAVFYTILLEYSTEIDTKNKKIEIQYIFLDDTTDDRSYSIHTVNVTKKDMDIVLSQIHNFWKLLNTADFKDGCDYCRLAKFVDFKLLKENLAKKQK